MEVLKKVFKILIVITASAVLLLSTLTAVLTATEYKPADRENVMIEHAAQADRHFSVGDELTLMTWNIGYGCLGDNADFFMDGGKGVKTADTHRIDENLIGIKDTIEKVRPDIGFFQEVDTHSARSEYENEAGDIRSAFNTGSSAFAHNYKVLFVPYPIPPIGRVEAGILTLVDDDITSAQRVQLPIPFSWPIRTANLKRCLLVTRIPVEGTDRELVLINLHLEAYDDGSGRIAQTAILKEILEKEAEAGNYVIAGGDFNQTFSSVDISMYPVYEGNWAPGTIDSEDFDNYFNIVMDNRIPSCRSLDKAYEGADHSNFQYYVVDGYVISKNLEILDYEVIDEEFRCSDHNPFIAKLKIME